LRAQNPFVFVKSLEPARYGSLFHPSRVTSHLEASQKDRYSSVGQPSPQPHNSIYLSAQTSPTPRPDVAAWLAHSLCIAKVQDQAHLSLMDLTLVALFRDKPARRLAREPPAIEPVEPQSAERARGERNIAKLASSLSPGCHVLRQSSATSLPLRCCAREISAFQAPKPTTGVLAPSRPCRHPTTTSWGIRIYHISAADQDG
jgi:hypothetical protein